MKLAQKALFHRFKQELAREENGTRSNNGTGQDDSGKLRKLKQTQILESARSQHIPIEEVPSEVKAIQAGSEVKLISEWTDLYDELDELKKIFFEFLKRWTDTERSDEFDPNRLVIYQVQRDAEEFKLSEQQGDRDYRQREELKNNHHKKSLSSISNQHFRNGSHSLVAKDFDQVKPHDDGARKANQE